ncbi:MULTISPECIES: GNAT family N-acetyltransferase [unclassified Shinella]|uniref:GNAT family N-acetyltransferase n=1 Tax=Shinella TaxID=323620 RepID=UPI00225D33B0|nr:MULTISPECIES: GNAT family N-acetyltransferase [unclassified Shinella]MCO5137895.1 GNAT family N-acetyltransferase [Shinella sp.]MDC7258012.1 GNAT family N-acetyltransferase [Shinella sp. YE25]CAI0335237.1 N-acetyltransferase domain-containing protein [Rhizobiaceae bacterium]CAK7259546.1 N-acetyltransferase domain-containing protein [Shinella sp. WSC3-e]
MDYLVNLSRLSPDAALDARMAEAGVTIRRALAPEARLVTDWVADTFGNGWASETAIALTRQPPTVFIATRARRLVGFACHESIARGFFGPTGVEAQSRGLGIGHALLLACLFDLKAMGYGYAIIGDVGPSAFYEKTVGAMPIPGSAPGIYAGMLAVQG